MGHNSVVSGHQNSTGIPKVDGLSTEPPDLGHHIVNPSTVSATWSHTQSGVNHRAYPPQTQRRLHLVCRQ